MSEKHERTPSGEWLGYPELNVEDIEYEAFKSSKYLAQFFVENRKARISLLMDRGFFQSFIEAVGKKYGNASSLNIEKAAQEAIKTWVKEIQSK